MKTGAIRADNYLLFRTLDPIVYVSVMPPAPPSNNKDGLLKF